MQSIQKWLVDVGVKTMGPSAIRGAILGVVGWLVAKNGELSAFGIISDSVAHTTTIQWDKLSIVAIALLPAAGAAVIKMLNYHGSKVVESIAVPTEE